ncbi:DUF308 domain-containing protein, partial [Lishizhenia sp.]|uniref:DUF308 domain-containing protein n=1 Tax=Lishizhenia sp. TaxID=2497594 RepID=UPI00299D9635
ELQEEKEGAEKQIQESQNLKKEQQDSLHDPERNSEPRPSKVKLRAFVPEKKVKEDNEAVYWSQSRKELSSPVSETSESKEEVELPKEIYTEEDGKVNRSEVRANIALILTTISLLCLYNFPLMLLGLVFGLTGFVFAIYAFTDKARTRKAKNRAIISGVAFLLFALVISGLIFWITLIDPMVLSFWV